MASQPEFPMLKSALKTKQFPPEAFTELQELIASHASLRRKVGRQDAEWRKVARPEGKSESVCERCWEANPVWYADSGDWNRAVGREQSVSFLCPRCFILSYEEATGETLIWALHRRDADPTAEALRLAQSAAWEFGRTIVGHAAPVVSSGDTAPGGIPRFPPFPIPNPGMQMAVWTNMQRRWAADMNDTVTQLNAWLHLLPPVVSGGDTPEPKDMK